MPLGTPGQMARALPHRPPHHPLGDPIPAPPRTSGFGATYSAAPAPMRLSSTDAPTGDEQKTHHKQCVHSCPTFHQHTSDQGARVANTRNGGGTEAVGASRLSATECAPRARTCATGALRGPKASQERRACTQSHQDTITRRAANNEGNRPNASKCLTRTTDAPPPPPPPQHTQPDTNPMCKQTNPSPLILVAVGPTRKYGVHHAVRT